MKILPQVPIFFGDFSLIFHIVEEDGEEKVVHESRHSRKKSLIYALQHKGGKFKESIRIRVKTADRNTHAEDL